MNAAEMFRTHLSKIRWSGLLICAGLGTTFFGGFSSNVWGVFLSASSTASELRIGFPGSTQFETWAPDPAHIRVTAEATVLSGLYGRLVDYNEKNQLVCYGASRYWVEGNHLHFELSSKWKTSTGRNLTARDVVASFHRLLKTNTNTHGNLLMFAEHDIAADAFIREQDGQVVIGPIVPMSEEVLVPLLANIDFSVIPLESLNPDNKIGNYKITSGAVYLGESKENGDFVLNRNIHHHLDPIHYDRFSFRLLSGMRSLEGIKSGTIHLSSSDFFHTSEDLASLELSKSSSKAEVFQGAAISILSARFSNKFMGRTTPEARFYIADQFRNLLLKEMPSLRLSHQLFPDLGEGQLVGTDLIALQDFMERSRRYRGVLPTKLRVGAYKGEFDILKKMETSFRFDVQFVELGSYYSPKDGGREPDLILVSGDSAFNEDISLVSYYCKSGFWGLTRDECNRFLYQYIRQPDKLKRLEMYRKLHLKVLMLAKVVPFSLTSNYAVAQAGLRLKFNPYIITHDFWKVYPN